MNAVRFVSKWPFDEHSELHTSFGIALSGILRNRTLSIRHLPFGTVPFGALALAIRKIIADHWRSLEITAEHPLSTQKLASNLFKSSNLPKFKIQNRIGRLHLAESTGRVESGYRTATERKNRLNAGRVLSTARPKSDLQKAANLPARKAHSKRNYPNERPLQVDPLLCITFFRPHIEHIVPPFRRLFCPLFLQLFGTKLLLMGRPADLMTNHHQWNSEL